VIDLMRSLRQAEKRHHVAFRKGCDDILHEADAIAWTLHIKESRKGSEQEFSNKQGDDNEIHEAQGH